MIRSRKVAIGIVGALATWAASYKLITEEVKKSSSIVRQTLFNLQLSPEARDLLGGSIKISSNVEGEMNQVKGLASISFKCTGDRGEALATLVARRNGAVWETTALALRPAGSADSIDIIK